MRVIFLLRLINVNRERMFGNARHGFAYLLFIHVDNARISLKKKDVSEV